MPLMTTLRLREWITSPALRLTGAQREALRTVLRATVQPSSQSDDCYDVTPGNVVGSAQVDGLTMLVEPKIPISRVLFLLGYSADTRAWLEGQATLGAEHDLVSGVVDLFATMAERALRRGLLMGYHQVEADLHTVRGRIDLAEQLRRRPGLDLPLAVRYDEHDEDITENRLLLAAAKLLGQLPLRGHRTRRSLHRLVDTLQNVSPVAYHPTAVPTVSWNRLNAHYRPAVEVARLLLQMQAPEVTAGSVRTATLAIDMAMLFEIFVRSALRESLSASPAQFPSGDTCPALALDVNHRVRLHPDLSYWPHGRCLFVGDVKYKRDTGPGHNDDLYQLLAYATATRLPAATLVYADGPPSPQTHRIAGTEVLLHVRHLDLGNAPTRLLEQVAALASQIRSDAAGAHYDVPSPIAADSA